jgi:TPR repeat protein
MGGNEIKVYENAKKMHLAKAEEGDAQAQFALGLVYKEHNKFSEAFYWLKKAADQGIANANSELDDCKIKEADFYIKKGFNNYPAIKECCNELAKYGYGFEYSEVSKDPYNKKGYRSAIILHDTKKNKTAGRIQFGTLQPTSSKQFWYTEYHLKREEIIYGKHRIQLDKAAIEISSDVFSSEAPPDWMMICAKTLASYSCTIDYPEWVKKYPDAKEYINVAFKNLGLLS